LRDYEILYIVRPDLEDDKVQDVVKRVNTLISRSGGSSDQTSLWGKRKLAYEVKHQREGSYVLQDFKIEPGRVPELESALKISEDVLRHLIVRKPEKSTTTTTSTPAAPPPAEATPEPVAAESRRSDAAEESDGDREER
jgi:small subunit ribosomal protein S6